MREERTYRFAKSSALQQGLEHYVKKESELNQQEEDLLLGELIKKWNDTPSKVRVRFLQSGMDNYRKKHAEDFFKKLNSLDK